MKDFGFGLESVTNLSGFHLTNLRRVETGPKKLGLCRLLGAQVRKDDKTQDESSVAVRKGALVGRTMVNSSIYIPHLALCSRLLSWPQAPSPLDFSAEEISREMQGKGSVSSTTEPYFLLTKWRVHWCFYINVSNRNTSLFLQRTVSAIHQRLSENVSFWHLNFIFSACVSTDPQLGKKSFSV